jgi:hypothetical protein
VLIVIILGLSGRAISKYNICFVELLDFALIASFKEILYLLAALIALQFEDLTLNGLLSLYRVTG